MPDHAIDLGIKFKTKKKRNPFVLRKEKLQDKWQKEKRVVHKRRGRFVRFTPF